jgi:hypothetical protein
MVAQGPLEAFVMVQIHAGQPARHRCVPGREATKQEMKTSRARRLFANLALLVLSFAAIGRAGAADFTVTAPEFAFIINGSNSPVLYLVRGRTYTFAVETTCDFHAFRINSPGVSNNVICSGVLAYTVPTNAANYYYDCFYHGQSMRGEIVTVESATPLPEVRIVSYVFTNTLVLRSTGTNTLNIFPEYKTDLNQSNWLALTVLTNRFLNGTNETIVSRPAGTNVFIRLRETVP